MTNLLLKTMIFAGLFGLFSCKKSGDPSTWSVKQIDRWFEKGNWLNGWHIKPDTSINRKEFAKSYFMHRERWDKAFTFLKENDLTQMEPKRYDIDGDNLYAQVSDYLTKNHEDAQYEAHRKYIDIQYVILGKEFIGIGPISETKDILQPYDESKDIIFMTVNQIRNSQADPGSFFIFFPDDLHRPGLKDGENSMVRKVVVKLKID